MRLKLVLSWMIAVVTVIASVGCGRPELEYDRVTLDGQDAVGVARSGVPLRGVVLFFHGMDRDESVVDFDEPHRQLTATLADAGYAVVAGSAGGNVWGNAASQKMYTELAMQAVQHYQADKLFFLTESMGTVAAMNLVAKNKDLSVTGVVAINPLLNLDALPPKYYAQAADANAGTPIPDVDPVDLPLQSMSGKRFRFYVTPDDQLVSTPQNANAFEKRFGSVADISIVKCTGQHMDPSCIQGKDIVEWFSSLDPR